MRCPICGSKIGFEETKDGAGAIRIGYCKRCDVTIVECRKYREIIRGEAKLPLKIRGFGDINLIGLAKHREMSINV